MNAAEFNTTVVVVDFLLLAYVAAVLVYGLARQDRKKSRLPLGAVLALVSGVALFVFSYIAGVTSLVEVLDNAGIGQPRVFGQEPHNWPEWLTSRVGFLLVLTGLAITTYHRRKLEREVMATRDRVRSAQDVVVQSESRFRHLFETTTNSFFCYTFDPPIPVELPVEEQVKLSHDAILTECNSVFARGVNKQTPREIIGTRMGILDGNKDEEAHRLWFGTFVRNDYRLADYEFIYKTPDGQERAVCSSLTGIVTDGKLRRVWGAETNILDIRKTQAALERRRRFQELVADISSHLIKSRTEGADQAVNRCLEQVCRHIGADRVTVFWLDREEQTVRSTYSWGQTKGRHERVVALADFPELVARLMGQEVVRIDNVDELPSSFSADKAGLLKTNIRSYAAIPLVVGGEVVGIVSLAHRSKSRVWTDEDIDELQVLSDLFANYVHRLKSRRALDDALNSLQRATDRLEAENVYLREEIELTHGFDEIIGQSEGVLHCLRLVGQVAGTSTPVLILGETGTGKELIARAIHEHSDRSDRPLVKINCSALPANLIESELFGYEKGAFTGADRRKRGRFDLADGSTLFLDEIGEIPLELQAKLLRVLQEGEFERLGGGKTISVDVRIIAATNQDLARAVLDGEFRSDLFYRINTFPIEIPPLRERGDDVQLLAEYFVAVHSKNLGREVSAISAEMMHRLREYAWPGNVRELESVVQRALISSTGPVLEMPATLIRTMPSVDVDEPRVLSTSIADLRIVEREHILSVLESTNWKISGDSGAAAQLGIPPSTLRSKMKKLEIVRPH